MPLDESDKFEVVTSLKSNQDLKMNLEKKGTSYNDKPEVTEGNSSFDGNTRKMNQTTDQFNSFAKAPPVNFSRLSFSRKDINKVLIQSKGMTNLRDMDRLNHFSKTDTKFFVTAGQKKGQTVVYSNDSRKNSSRKEYAMNISNINFKYVETKQDTDEERKQ